jgi:acyl-coenzyme A thioesterase 9
MPNRAPILWSEALLNATSTSECSEGHSATTEAPTSEQPLPPRYMHDTYAEILLPFASSPELFERYTNAWGGLRTGMLMEHLDSLAGSISYKHMLGPDVETLGRIRERGFYIVTASVDRLVGIKVKLHCTLKLGPDWTFSPLSRPSGISA